MTVGELEDLLQGRNRNEDIAVGWAVDSSCLKVFSDEFPDGEMICKLDTVA